MLGSDVALYESEISSSTTVILDQTFTVDTRMFSTVVVHTRYHDTTCWPSYIVYSCTSIVHVELYIQYPEIGVTQRTRLRWTTYFFTYGKQIKSSVTLRFGRVSRNV